MIDDARKPDKKGDFMPSATCVWRSMWGPHLNKRSELIADYDT
jgi:hypothetical protein